MRPPRPSEIVLLVAVGSVVGAFFGRSRSRQVSHEIPPAPSPVYLVTDGGPPSSEDASISMVDDAPPRQGYTVDDDHEPEPPSGDTTDVDKLLAFVPMKMRDDKSLAIARRWLGPGKNHGNQGNPETSTHAISREQCKAGLKGVVLQSEQDRQICGGPWEVAIHNGDPTKATTCIDVFEYPNRPCVLPMVFTTPIAASAFCELQGKRLCAQEEWNAACEADPKGGPPTKYAYGDELDLTACHTGKGKNPRCDVDHGLWKTCSTDDVPTGSYPRCRSRLGVFDQHGNVAEAMTRKEKNVTYVQLKGSAWFYDGKMYADDCRFDPRWHVDPVNESWHTNYHLGFRCCRSVTPLASR